MQTDFSGYGKISDSLQQLVTDEQAARLMKKATWVATEKVHGANFCVSATADGVRFGKRKSWLEPNDDFFAWQLIAPELEEHALHLLHLLRSTEEAQRVTLFGELFGGKYPHPMVPKVGQLQPIQTGIWYAPDIRFYAFDIAVEKEGVTTYLDFETAVELFEKVGILHARPLATGQLSKVMEFDTRITTLIPSWLGLPALAVPNIMEGIVVRPLQELLLTGSKNDQRVLFKIKNREFDEEDQYHQAQNWRYEILPPHEYVSLLVMEAEPLLNANRLQSAVSKAGQLSISIPGRVHEIRDLVMEDLMNELNLRHGEVISSLKKEDLHELQQLLQQKVIHLIYHRLNQSKP